MHIAIYSLLFTFLFLFVAIAATIASSEYSEALADDFWDFFLEGLSNIGVLLLIVFFLIGLIGAAIANKAEKAGRSWLAFFWLSALVSPIVMGIIAVTLKPSNQGDSESTASISRVEPTFEAKLLELQSLKDKGIISEEEFEQAKKKALGI